MKTIKKLFEYSSDSVVITDMEFNILERNKNAGKLLVFLSENCSEIFEDYEKPLASGNYISNIGGMDVEFKVIHYQEEPENDDIYVIQTDADDILHSFLSKKDIRKLAENRAAAMRSYVSGIINSNEAIINLLGGRDDEDIRQFADIVSGNCCKLLRDSVCMNELVKYTYDNDLTGEQIPDIDLSEAAEEFVLSVKKLFKRKMMIELDTEKDIFIKCEPERLKMFFSALLIAANDNDPENNFISISVTRSGDDAIVSISAEQMGTDDQRGKYSKEEPLHKGEKSGVELLMIERFCKRYGGTIVFSEGADNTRTVSVKLPVISGKYSKRLETHELLSESGKFSKYEIMLSEILYN